MSFKLRAIQPKEYVGDEALTIRVADDRYAKKTDLVTIENTLASKADKSELTNYLTINTDQTVSGRKTFTTSAFFNSGQYFNDTNYFIDVYSGDLRVHSGRNIGFEGGGFYFNNKIYENGQPLATETFVNSNYCIYQLYLDYGSLTKITSTEHSGHYNNGWKYSTSKISGYTVIGSKISMNNYENTGIRLSVAQSGTTLYFYWSNDRDIDKNNMRGVYVYLVKSSIIKSL